TPSVVKRKEPDVGKTAFFSLCVSYSCFSLCFLAFPIAKRIIFVGVQVANQGVSRAVKQMRK
ncbi:MAG: hypothetical protein SOR23_06550, partial [Candidatus Enterosoma sp.]|nr:hypothetical protein [Candidatus Enterosoma sp.]